MRDITMPYEMAELLAQFLYLGQSLAQEMLMSQHHLTLNEDAPYSEKEKQLIAEVAQAGDEAFKKAFHEKAEKLLQVANRIALMRPHDTNILKQN